MNVLLIRPRPHPETIGLQSVMICEPLELMYLSAALKKTGNTVRIIDMILEKRPLEYFIKKHAPGLVGITGYISHVNVMKGYAKRIKAIDSTILVAVGGVHAEVCPEDFDCGYIDRVCSGAEDFLKLAHCELDSLPFPDRELEKRYRRRYYYLFHRDCALIKTSYGCPYNCRFCFCKNIAPYSARPVDDVIAELKTISQTEVYIVDDDFLFNRGRLREFAEKLRMNRIEKRFLVYGRADFIAANGDMIELLSGVGLRAVIVGLEACSQEELNAYNKKSALSDSLAAVRILQKHGVECYGTVILGMDWDKSSFDALYRWLKVLNLVFVNLQPLTPMPSTPYFEEYRDSLIVPYKEAEKWDMAHLVVRPRKLSVRQYYWQIIKLYYRITVNPEATLYMIKRYGLLNTLKLSAGAGAVTLQYIKKMMRGF